MSRRAGQVDPAKREALLKAAAELIGTHGPAVSIDEIANQAGASRQTLYNQFGSKIGLIEALIDRGREELASTPLHVPANMRLVDALESYAVGLLRRLSQPHVRALLRASTDPGSATLALFDAVTPLERTEIEVFLRRESLAGRLAVADPAAAVDLFHDLVATRVQLMIVLGLTGPSDTELERRARSCAEVFVYGHRPPPSGEL